MGVERERSTRRGMLRYAWPLAALVVVLAAACGRPGSRGVPDPGRFLAQGRVAAHDWIAAGRHGDVQGASVVVLGYLERQRLGLGDPFRLADEALNDPRLGSARRRELAWAILARAADREDYFIDGDALDGVARRSPPGSRVGAAHLALIEGAVSEAGDPRAGELAIRLAYGLAAAEGDVSRSAPVLAAQAAALIGDRELAQRDVARLLAAARRRHIDALRVLETWRAQRRFLVERPDMAPIAEASEVEAMDLAPRLAAAIRALSPTPVAANPEPASAVPVMTPGVALRLETSADSLDMPPSVPVIMALRLHRAGLATGLLAGLRRLPPWGPGAEPGPEFIDASVAAERLLSRARDEEHFVAEHTLLWYGEGGETPIMARIALAAAAGLRVDAQEPPWFPGDGGPSEAELIARFGLKRVDFDPGVPADWRPYYRRTLARALTDARRVLPSLDVRGLSIRFGRVPAGMPDALAVHDPETRTIVLPPWSGAGTLAHELAHDMDWQLALRRFHLRGDYATDQAVRHDTPLALSVAALGEAPLDPPAPGQTRVADHDRRPAEVFARSVDWLMVVGLAAEGRSDGYLSSAQDPLLTGYGSTTPPAPGGRAGDALIAILDQASPVAPQLRRWYLQWQGTDHAPAAWELERMVLGATSAGAAPGPSPALAASARGRSSDVGVAPRPGVPASMSAAFAGIDAARRRALEALARSTCSRPGTAYDRPLGAARMRLVSAAASARARGVALRRAARLAGRAGREWVAHRLYGEPATAARIGPVTKRRLASLVSRARAVAGTGSSEPAANPFRIVAPPTGCPLGPFADSARWPPARPNRASS